ncbi:MAG: DUF819 family protein [Gemmatimonadales bacterium]|jgi:uncharacterized membrane protein
MNASAALITDPTAVFGYIAAVAGLIFWASTLPRFRKLFALTPPVIYAYFVPTISAAVGIIPGDSLVYGWMTRYLLLVALILLMLSVDVKSILRLGPMALFMVVAGSVGIVLGAVVSFLLFGAFLPEESWKAFAALSGSWIGGTANMVAIAESVGTPDALMGPIIVIDTVVGYGWMGLLLFFSAFQHRFDASINAHTEKIEETNRRLATVAEHRHPLTTATSVIIVGIGFGSAILAAVIGDRLPALGDPTIISHTTWAVLIVVTGGLALSFTPVSRLEEYGASRFGYTALYLLLGAIGAQANLRAVIEAPAFLAAGVVWIGVHALVLLAAARIVRAPLFFFATASMANIGGVASAPIVAGVYHRAMAPVGLLMAVVGYVLGIYGALGAAWILGVIGG